MNPLIKCGRCLLPCDRTIIFGVFYDARICNCGTIFCGSCVRTKKCDCHSREQRYEYPLFSKMLTFINHAPVGQKSLINLQTCVKVNCARCGVKSTNYRFTRSEIQDVVCVDCDTDSHTSSGKLWFTDDQQELVFLGLIDLLRGQYMPKIRDQLPGTYGLLPVRITNCCQRCSKEIWAEGKNSCRPYILDGRVNCYDCGASICKYFRKRQHCYCLCKFIDFIGCIPENQLRLLTYSKWVKAVDCDLHLDILNELTAVSSDGSRKGKLRDFFKPDYSAGKLLPVMNSTTTATSANSANNFKQLTSKLSTLDISTPVAMATKQIVCPCGRDEALAEVFICNTCSVYGICPLCVVRNHWGHEVQDAVKRVTVSLVNAHAENTLVKLTKWSRQVNVLNQESEKAFTRLCSALGATFADAINNNENNKTMQTMLEQANISSLDVYFNDYMNSARKLYEAVYEFCDDLENAAKQSLAQENSRAQKKNRIRTKQPKRKSNCSLQ